MPNSSALYKLLPTSIPCPCASPVQICLIPLSAEEFPYHRRLLRVLIVQHFPPCSFVVLFMDTPIANYSALIVLRSRSLSFVRCRRRIPKRGAQLGAQRTWSIESRTRTVNNTIGHDPCLPLRSAMQNDMSPNIVLRYHRFGETHL